ncbi:F-box protein CPR1-like [Corylus avellana]|uniref:F-box protein CPR1-like n=1 Tax=Corylus avellana TaxID=13451 RepID=UPI00286B9CFC|nr:F-box protein CPR1-like [Corylus avellana]
MTNILPQELITEILSLLLVKPLMRFQCVSKAWFVTINDPDFIKMHLNRSIETNRERALIADANNGILPHSYYLVNFSDNKRFSEPMEICPPFNHPTTRFIKIVGHCNGLICLHICPFCCSNIEERNKYPNEIVIWNPLIRKYKKLPFKPIENPDDYELKLAFGYDQINDDYKVVRILKPLLASVSEVCHHVYSLRGNSWRKVEDKWPRKDLYLNMNLSASLNGALHWVAGRRRGLTSAIIAFDLSTEKFRVHALPIEINFLEYNTHLVVLGGCLCVWEANCQQFFDVWVMKEYGVAASNWTLLYRLPQGSQQTPSYAMPVALSNNGKEVLMHEYSGKLYWYNIKKKRSRIVEIQKSIEKCDLNIVVVGSLLLLDGELDH